MGATLYGHELFLKVVCLLLKGFLSYCLKIEKRFLLIKCHNSEMKNQIFTKIKRELSTMVMNHLSKFRDYYLKYFSFNVQKFMCDGPERLLDLLSPLVTQVKIEKYQQV